MRITGGTLRSRALKAPKGQATRPTTDRVREALFGILLGGRHRGGARARPLRGHGGPRPRGPLARRRAAVLVESAREALAVLRANVAALGLEDRARGRGGRRRAARCAGRPRAGPVRPRLRRPAVGHGRRRPRRPRSCPTSPGGEGSRPTVAWCSSTRRARPPFDIDGLVRLDTRRYGDTALTFYKPAILAALRQ